MRISFSQIALSLISFGLGYYFKARFEINQEKEILNLKRFIQKKEEDHEEEARVLNYKYYQLERSKSFLERDFFEFKEKVKLDRFDKIESVRNEKDSASHALKQFL